MQKKSYIISARRTAIGSLHGVLSGLSATELGSIVLKGMISYDNIILPDIDEAIIGQVLTCGAGQLPARQTALNSGLSQSVECTTINKVCGSGLKAVMLADDRIRLNQVKLVIAGGQESMSNSPYYLPKSKIIPKLAQVKVSDSVTTDALTDPFNRLNMGQIADLCSSKFGLTKKQLDDFAFTSYIKSTTATNSGKFAGEIIGISTQRRLQDIYVDKDEEPFRFSPDKVYSFKSTYTDEGVITAGNSSKINDGAALLAVTSEEYCQSANAKPLVEIVAHCSVAVDPLDYLTAPSKAINKVLDAAGLNINDIDLFEINEAFATVVLVNQHILSLDPEKINVNGGAVSMGHPVGASGARILVTLIHEMKRRKLTYGLATACIGSGEGVAMIVKNVQ